MVTHPLVERAEVRLLALPLVEPFRAAHGALTERALVVVRIETDIGHGWGECSALPDPTYTGEWAADAFDRLGRDLLPLIVGQAVGPTEAVAALGEHGQPMAAAAVEMALLDAALRAEGRSLASHLGVDDEVTSVVAGAAVGLGTVAEVVASAERQAAAGFGRIKLKIQPGHDVDVVAAVVDAVPDVEVQVDGNGSFDATHLDALAGLGDLGVTAIEQPFAPDDVASAASLTERSSAPVVADEAAPDLNAVRALQRAGALGGVSIKPPRVGGLGRAVELHDLCRTSELKATAGGMIECGLGRRSLAALAALPAFTLAGDVSPAARWLKADPWPDLAMGAGEQHGRILVPDEPGVAPDPDPELLERLTVRRHVVRPG
ncbi:MAG: o-succinylbenzoate synthase [Actinomycetota bacterium]